MVITCLYIIYLSQFSIEDEYMVTDCPSIVNLGQNPGPIWKINSRVPTNSSFPIFFKKKKKKKKKRKKKKKKKKKSIFWAKIEYF